VKCVVIVPNVLPSHCGERVGPGGNGFVKFVELFSRSSRFFGYFDCKSTIISFIIGDFVHFDDSLCLLAKISITPPGPTVT
jgi:hypothetical protein